VTIGLLFAIKGVGQQAFYRWLKRDFADCFPRLTERTRLFRRLRNNWQWTLLFFAKPSLLFSLLYTSPAGPKNAELLQPGGLPAKSLRVERSDTPG